MIKYFSWYWHYASFMEVLGNHVLLFPFDLQNTGMWCGNIEYVLSCICFVSASSKLVTLWKSYLHLLQPFQRVQEGPGDPWVPMKKKKTSKGERQFPLMVSRGHHFTATCWSITTHLRDQKNIISYLVIITPVKCIKYCIILFCKTIPFSPQISDLQKFDKVETRAIIFQIITLVFCTYTDNINKSCVKFWFAAK